jgi:serine protease Do
MTPLSRRRALTMLGAAVVATLAAGAAAAERPALVGLIAASAPAVVAIGSDKAILGSGFRIAGTRYIATAAHVVAAIGSGAAAGKTVRVRWRKENFSAHVLRTNADADLALLELDADAPMPGLTLARKDAPAEPGEWIVVLGCPFGGGTTATTGIISAAVGAIEEPVRLKNQIQLNAAVNPGNSGGPVLNLAGEVIGIANASIPGGFGLGFATASDELAALVAAPGR